MPFRELHVDRGSGDLDDFACTHKSVSRFS
jgi:hypothetical protein